MEENYINIGKINIKYFQEINNNIITDEVVLTKERYLHIIEGHKEDFELYGNMMSEIIENPNYILKDYNNIHTKNSIMTFYRIRDKNLKKLQEKNKTIYKKE